MNCSAQILASVLAICVDCLDCADAQAESYRMTSATLTLDSGEIMSTHNLGFTSHGYLVLAGNRYSQLVLTCQKSQKMNCAVVHSIGSIALDKTNSVVLVDEGGNPDVALVSQGDPMILQTRFDKGVETTVWERLNGIEAQAGEHMEFMFNPEHNGDLRGSLGLLVSESLGLIEELYRPLDPGPLQVEPTFKIWADRAGTY